MGEVNKENAQTKKQKQSKDTSKTNIRTRYLGTLDSLLFKNKNGGCCLLLHILKKNNFPLY